MSNIKVPLLIVDDKKFMLDSVKSYIENKKDWNINGVSYEFEVMTTQDAETAILLYTKYNHDIVIMDLGMPKMDGLTATKLIFEINPNANIIGMASESDKFIEEFRASGIKFYLDKPFQDTYINSRIQHIMDEITKTINIEDLDIQKRKKSVLKKILSK